MSTGIALLVLLAAFLHAFWNAVVKGAGDKTVVLGLIALGHVIPGIILLTSFEAPSKESVPYIIASTLVHYGYYMLLNVAYRTGDLSTIYPIARGLAPAMVALGAQFWVGERLPPLAWGGIALVSCGTILLASGLFRGKLDRVGLLAAVGTAIVVATYSIIDGIGIRISGSAAGYIGWLFMGDMAVAVFVYVTCRDRLMATSRKTIALGFLGGMVSGTAYGLVLYAKLFAPLGVVSSLRETSVVFAAMIGVLWFGEGPPGKRLFAAAVVGGGIVLIGLS